jgi:alpha-ketoglutarate-dependent taurine dioxygenase
MNFLLLHPRFGVEVMDLDLRDIAADHGYSGLRTAFEEDSLLLFRGQSLTDDQHNDFVCLFGPLEDRPADVVGTTPRVRPPLPVQDFAYHCVTRHDTAQNETEHQATQALGLVVISI